MACHRVRLPFQSCPLPEPRQNASSYDGRRLSGLLASAFGITQGSCSNRVNKGRVSSCLYRSEELSRNGRSHEITDQRNRLGLRGPLLRWNSEFSRQIVIRSCNDKQLRILGPPAVACHRVRLPFQSCPLPEPRQNASSYDGRRLSGLLASAFGITQGSCSHRVNRGRVSSCLYRSEELSRNGRSHEITDQRNRLGLRGPLLRWKSEFSRQIVIRSCRDKQLRILGPPAVACHRVRLPFQSCPLPEPRQNASSYDGRRLSGLLASAFGITQGSCSIFSVKQPQALNTIVVS